MADQARALQLKEEGNKYYQQGNYTSAEAMYSKAIIADPKNPALYTNRAMARIKLSLWDNVVEDCRQALHLEPANMKAFYQLSQGQLELGSFVESVESARKAQQLCIKNNDRSLHRIMAQLRKAMKARWEEEDRHRLLGDEGIHREMVGMCYEHRDAALARCTSDAERRDVIEEHQDKIVRIAEIFDLARVARGERLNKDPPEFLTCPISFQVMLDPLVTRAGHSYDRENIEEHVKHHETDPFTREPLYMSDLRPNLALKEACEAYLKKNGHHVDY